MTKPTKSNRWCLFLDVDGTLIEIAATPDGARVDPSLQELLNTTSATLGGAVALISGRSLEQLDRMFAPARWPAAGQHGLERRDASGRVHRARLDDTALATARLAMAAAAAEAPGAVLEDKGLALALHYRHAPAFEQQLRREVSTIARQLGDAFHVQEGRRVLELKPVAATKADAIRAFTTEAPFDGRRPMFIGDDLTDLDGFAAVEQLGGLSVAVGDHVTAMLRVAAPSDVRALLAGVAEGRVPA